MKYSIGLDCGITSVGYAVMQLDYKDEPVRIIRLGSRIFNAAEHPKNGSSLAAPRREARGNRRRIRRHKHRLERIRSLIINENLLNNVQLEALFDGKLDDIYKVRCQALDEKISNENFARVLINLAQRRGFKSNRKVDIEDKEAGKLLTAVSDNERLMSEKGYRTVGEMLYKDEKYSEFKRNKGGNYVNTVSRSMIEDEVRKIFEVQRRLGNHFATEENENKYLDILLSQRPFDLGPGVGNTNSPSPYAGNQILKMIGKCTLIPEEYRAPKASYSFQLFSLWQNINNLKLVSINGEKILLTNEERSLLFNLCHKSANVTYKRIRKELGIGEEYLFNSLSYGDKERDAVENKSSFNYLKEYHQIRTALDKLKKGYISVLSVDELDAIGYIFSVFKSDLSIISSLKDANINETIYDCLLTLKGFSKFGHISIKACKALIPFLEQGYTYDKACVLAGFAVKEKHKSKTLPSQSEELNDITNPVVRRAVSQTIKVVNAIINEQGEQPVYINIELARELSKSRKERDEIAKSQAKNHRFNEDVIQKLREEFNINNPKGMDIVKFKLWQEQDGICPYTQKQIDLTRIFEPGYVDVDHIIPYSICFDNSYNNKVLTFSNENRQKSNRIPMQYLHGKDKDDFVVWVNSNVKNYRKKQNLLKENIFKADFDGFKERNLNDTKYLSRFLLNYINNYLEFKPFESGRKKHVTAVNGAVTSYVRTRWGISKIRQNGDLHHAVDAAVIACITDGTIQKVTRYSKFKETKNSQAYDYDFFDSDVNTSEVYDKFPLPYREFVDELDFRTRKDPQYWLKQSPLKNYSLMDIENVKPIFVSRMPRHKVTGAAHKDTIRSGKEKGYSISKVALSDLKLDEYGEIKNYYNPESDKYLYNALKARLSEFNGDGKAAFPADYSFHKPKSDGTEGPIVKKVKIIEKTGKSVLARGKFGIADNDSMIRIDIFFVENEGYYFVPIYVADTIKKDLPSLASVAGGKEWKKMDDKNFVFSLYPNDLIKVISKKEMKFSVHQKDSTLPSAMFDNNVFLYYINAGIGTASITVETLDSSYTIKSMGIKSLIRIEKYIIDSLGNISKVKKEERMGFNK